VACLRARYWEWERLVLSAPDLTGRALGSAGGLTQKRAAHNIRVRYQQGQALVNLQFGVLLRRVAAAVLHGAPASVLIGATSHHRALEEHVAEPRAVAEAPQLATQ
jgi:hypothetical protein